MSTLTFRSSVSADFDLFSFGGAVSNVLWAMRENTHFSKEQDNKAIGMGKRFLEKVIACCSARGKTQHTTGEVDMAHKLFKESFPLEDRRQEGWSVKKKAEEVMKIFDKILQNEPYSEEEYNVVFDVFLRIGSRLGLPSAIKGR